MADRNAYIREADRAARRHNIDPAIFKAMIQQESGFREGVGSSAGARDIAQFMPATARAYGVTLGDGKVSDDLDGAARYLAANLKRTGGNYKAALSIYNSGRPDAYKDPNFAKGQTYNYVRSIMRMAKDFGGAGGNTHGGGSQAGSGSARGRSAVTVDIPTSEESTSFDQEAFDRAKKLSVLGAYLKGKNPNNPLLRAGVLTDKAPDPSDFTKTETTTGTEKFTIPGTGDSTPAGGGGSSTPAGGLAAKAERRADIIDAKRMPYLWGGGHGAKITDAKNATPLDCSGAVSAVLGIDPRVSGGFEKWGRPGAGNSNQVTIYANDEHVLMRIGDRFFGTSGSNPGGGAGWIPASAVSKQYLSRFTVRHSER